jgi:hypothetical protein
MPPIYVLADTWESARRFLRRRSEHHFGGQVLYEDHSDFRCIDCLPLVTTSLGDAQTPGVGIQPHPQQVQRHCTLCCMLHCILALLVNELLFLQ